MATDIDAHTVEMSEVWTGMGAVLLVPVMLPLAAASHQPWVRSTLKQGLAFSERCREAVADAQERLEDLWAEAEADVAAELRQNGGQMPDPSAQGTAARRQPWGAARDTTEAADQLQEMMHTLNAQISWLTEDRLDLRMLLTLGLGAMAVRQLLWKGLALEDIPWYVFAWYALDTFIKFHPDVVGPWAPPQPPEVSAADAVAAGPD